MVALKKKGVSAFQENIKESIVKMIQNIPKKSWSREANGGRVGILL